MDNFEFYLSEQVDKYSDEWVAVVDGKVVAHGANARQVYNDSRRQHPNKTPFLACVPKSAAMIL